MACSWKIARVHSLLLLSIAGFIILNCVYTEKSKSLKSPFRPVDVLPLLPRQVSWPALTKLNEAQNLLPKFVGAAAATNNSILQWSGSCFYNNTAWLVLHNNSGTEFGGGTLHIKVSNAHSWTCMDLYIFSTPYRVTWDYYFLSREHTLEFESWETQAELEYVKNRGVSIFLLPAGMLGTLRALWEVFPLFSNSEWGENSNLKFLEKHMDTSFEVRPEPWVTNITVDDIHSGDFLVLSKIRGRWGAFETLEKWVTGSYAGHTAVCLRDSEGKLWVAESGHEVDGEDIIAIMPWEEWWEFELTKDDANPQIALLPLHPDQRASFNETAAWEYAKSMSGKPYGYHNLIFSWIDTVNDNFPEPLDAHMVASVMTVWTQMMPAYAGNLWNEALNKRLGTQNLTLPEILVEVERRGSSFGELLAKPEQDNWVYEDGMSASCVAYVFELYKAAGLFGKLSSKIQVTEFTIKDAYSVKFFENDPRRLPKWCDEGDTEQRPFCQIRGKYRMELPGYNTVEPYAHMNEKCESLPTEYYRTPGC
ncbi:uncharacterized protein LOC127247317 [Andrographis paniculata]|uniref:uncharacterized protein LOC127247317 n=1 Tax=Andrographis paniculata TaxID=175694 RepID=UPI0021E9AA01|nr:uncharacterized protein LOC127247317 [Andrographis paniculata]